MYDEEALVRADDQQFNEVFYKPLAGLKCMLPTGIVMVVFGIFCYIMAFKYGWGWGVAAFWLLLVGPIVLIVACCGITCIEPNEAVFLTHCTKYVGTLKQNGIFWTHPKYSKKKYSLKINNFETSLSKVNDANGTPIEIQCVVVWKIRDTAKVAYACTDHVAFLHIQAESAMRRCAALYPYECDDEEPSLRGSPVQVSAALRQAVQDRVDKCGVEIVEAKISHLAYAPEIAASMLKKQ